ncbi:hypothetical protein R3P38DRAFT_3205089 [Favolaschia claudopus]|uniref:Uncharacterized protein n=1 Tax=Favolaschia claudopus TaxID=2862362 RepID=A0AAW0AQ12_9AGAR
MKCQTLGTDSKHLHLDSAAKQAKKPPIKRQLTPATKAARLEASRKYRWNNEDVLREKARMRMAALKESEGTSHASAESVKKAHKNYREKNGKFLAFKQRLRRQEAYIAKYGAEAYHVRAAREQARAEAAMTMQVADSSAGTEVTHWEQSAMWRI